MRAGLVRTGTIAACVALLAAAPAGARAQEFPTPTVQAVAGQRFTGSGMSGDPVDASCGALRDVSINWRDGSSLSAPSSAALTADSATVGSATIPVQRVSVTVEHVFAAAGDYDVRVNYTVTCTRPDGTSYDFQGVDEALFVVHVSAGSGSGSGCAAVAAAQAAAAHAAQTACPYPPPVTAPKTPKPQAVRDWYDAKWHRLAERSAFWCGDWSEDTTAAASYAARVVFFPICFRVGLQLRYYDSIVNDPPDAGHAAEVALPARIAVPAAKRPRCTTGACSTAAHALTRFGAAAARVASIARAQSATVDRFSGAATLAGARSPADINDMQVLQAATFKALGGELATALHAKHAAGVRLATALRRAHVDASLSDAKARVQADRLTRLEGLDPSVLAALKRDGMTEDQLRALFTAAAQHARGATLTSALVAQESTGRLVAHYRSLTAAEVAHLEDALARAKKIAGGRHAKLRRALANAAAATAAPARRAAMRRFAAAARGLRGEAGTLLRTAGQAVR
jgi:hypothetical protein